MYSKEIKQKYLTLFQEIRSRVFQLKTLYGLNIREEEEIFYAALYKHWPDCLNQCGKRIKASDGIGHIFEK